MLPDFTFNYKKKYYINIDRPADNLFYFFDYDDRSRSINMEFQHFHPFYEVYILLDPAASHIIEGRPYPLKKFDIVCLSPNLIHKSEYPVGPPVKRLVIRFQIPMQNTAMQNELAAMFEIFHAPVPIYRFDPVNQKNILKYINEIFDISQDYDLKNSGGFDISPLRIHNKFMEFLAAVFLYQKDNRYVPDAYDTTFNKIYMITSYIHNHFNEDLSLSALAKKYFMSTCYLSHLFKTVTGFTLTDYVQMTRIRNAEQMLLFTDYKIMEIAERCGFKSLSQFNRVFNKVCNTSPRLFKVSGSAKKEEHYLINT